MPESCHTLFSPLISPPLSPPFPCHSRIPPTLPIGSPSSAQTQIHPVPPRSLSLLFLPVCSFPSWPVAEDGEWSGGMCGLRRKLSLFGSGMFFPEPKGSGPSRSIPGVDPCSVRQYGGMADEMVPRCGRKTSESSTAILAIPRAIQNPVLDNQCHPISTPVPSLFQSVKTGRVPTRGASEVHSKCPRAITSQTIQSNNPAPSLRRESYITGALAIPHHAPKRGSSVPLTRHVQLSGHCIIRRRSFSAHF